MSFVIDDAKVEELLRSPGIGYHISPASKSIFPAEEDIPYYPTNMAGGVTFTYSEPVPSEARANLLNLRRQIETSGVQLINSEELDTEIREIRR